MTEFKYEVRTEVSIAVSPCPCCGGKEIKFYSQGSGCAESKAWGSVRCYTCGHAVEIKEVGEEESKYKNSGFLCLMAAIDRWNAQYLGFTATTTKEVRNEY